MRKHLRIILMSISLVFTLSILAIAADNPLVGTWKMNPAKSKASPGPMDKSATWKLEAQENGQKDTFDGIDSDGKAYHVHAEPKYDGKDYPITGSADSDSVAIKKIDANNFEYVVKKAGKEVSMGRLSLSKDGKTLTESGKGRNSKGQETSYTTVWERQ